jgi:hypothetical protein
MSPIPKISGKPKHEKKDIFKLYLGVGHSAACTAHDLTSLQDKKIKLMLKGT